MPLKEKRSRKLEILKTKRIGTYKRKIAEYVHWSDEQEDSLIKERVQTYGVGKWAKLLKMGWSGLDGFNNHQLRNKWSNLVKAKDPRIEGL
jgi:hypothetical protein